MPQPQKFSPEVPGNYTSLLRPFVISAFQSDKRQTDSLPESWGSKLSAQMERRPSPEVPLRN